MLKTYSVYNNTPTDHMSVATHTESFIKTSGATSTLIFILSVTITIPSYSKDCPDDIATVPSLITLALLKCISFNSKSSFCLSQINMLSGYI